MQVRETVLSRQRLTTRQHRSMWSAGALAHTAPMTYKRNAVQCRICDDVIESTYGHDFKWCSCRAVAVDGGPFYLRRCGHQEDMIELSERAE